MDFTKFSSAVNKRVNFITSGKKEIYRMDVNPDELWQRYLSSFPEGTNPHFRERTEHDCNCCRSFIRSVGNLVSFDNDGNIQTIWDNPVSEPVYDLVSKSLAELVKSGGISNIFRSTESFFGKEKSHSISKDNHKLTINWDHFYCSLPARFSKDDIGTELSTAESSFQVLERSLKEIKLHSIETVLDLIQNSSIYRGEEHLSSVKEFLGLHKEYSALNENEAKFFVWKNIYSKSSRFRNMVIGTLCEDLSDNMDLEKAIARFEAKVAPHNYKRSKAPITKAMIDKAVKEINELGLEEAILRRHARMSDISPQNVLFVDRSSKHNMKDNLSSLLMQSAKVTNKPGNKLTETDVSSEEFFNVILPGAESVDFHFENNHTPNLCSLTTCQVPDSGKLFKWDNPFAWVYDGGIADSSMRKAVVERGGRVDGVFRFTHSWNHEGARNGSLMDLHVFMPGSTISEKNVVDDNYGNNNRVGWNLRTNTRSGGVQDVDYTDVAPMGYIPVENITFPNLSKMPQGKYICKIHNWRHRSPTEGGFKAEIECGGNIYHYEYKQPMSNKEWVTVAVVTLKDGNFTVNSRLPETVSQVDAWGIKTGTTIPVEAVMLSPNYWGDDGVGNKHHLFILKGCKNPNSVRGFFNEFLRGDLDKHRKVFEVLSQKMSCDFSEEQLSGVGFSSTKNDRAKFSVRKNGSTRVYSVQF